MADPNPNPPADPAGDPPADPKPQGDPAPADPPKDGEEGKGGKDAILADLAKERDKRQSLEKQFTDLQNQQQSQLDAIAKALGLKGDEPPDPEKLTQQLTQEQQRAREAAVQLAVYRSAATAGGDPDALLDSASFLRGLGNVDPADSEAVATAIKAAVEANPRLGANGTRRSPRPDPTQGRPPGQPLDPRAADLAQIEADLAAARRR